MKFIAKDEIVKQIICNAINASKPMGMGWMRYDKDYIYKPEDIKLSVTYADFDYVGGRMVKLYMKKLSDNDCDVWEFDSDNLSVECQSWCSKYPTVRDLLESVDGVQIIEEEK